MRREASASAGAFFSKEPKFCARTEINASGCIGSSYKAEKLCNTRRGMSGGDVVCLEDRITILGLEGRRLRSAPFCCNVWA